MLDNSWKRWVAENKLLGIPDQELVDTMKRNGFSEQTARAELMALEGHPYYLAANHYTQLLHKRQSLAMIERQLHRLDPKYCIIERKSNVSRAEFLEHYYSKSRPVILTDLMHNWAAMTRWTPEYLKETCGETIVSISTERDKNPNYETDDSAHRKNIKFSEYIDMVTTGGETNDYYLTARGDFFQNPGVRPMISDMEMFPEYLLPDTNVGVNLWYGPKGTFTPLHHDVMNILLAQVKGRKTVRLIPASEMDLVYNDDGVYSPILSREPDYAKFPKFREASIMEFELAPGEVLFIPVGWWHDVKALEMSINISCTNFVFPNHFTFVSPKKLHTSENKMQVQAQNVMQPAAINAEWKGWINENLRRGCDPVGLVEIMQKNGFTLDAIRQAMGVHFPAKFGMASAITMQTINYQALASVPVAQMEWKSGFKYIENDKLQLYTIENFLTDEECDKLIELSDPNVRPSTITIYSEGYRTSYTSDLIDLKSPFVEEIDKKISTALGIRLSYSEGIQAQRYDIGQEFKAHTDFFEPNTDEYKVHATLMGNRTWTFMIYLNTTPKGGETRFTNIDKNFKPVKGMAVVWNNLYPDGTVNRDSMHWGMPVEEGQKYIITKWFREKGQGPMFYNDAAV